MKCLNNAKFDSQCQSQVWSETCGAHGFATLSWMPCGSLCRGTSGNPWLQKDRCASECGASMKIEVCEKTVWKDLHAKTIFSNILCRIGSRSIDFAAKQRFRHRFERSVKLSIDPQRIKISYTNLIDQSRFRWYIDQLGGMHS